MHARLAQLLGSDGVVLYLVGPRGTELVVAAQADHRAFAPLYERYQDDLLRYCFYRLGDWDEAADATQQIFANALAGLAGFVDRGDSFRRWLFTIAHHEVGARQRRWARRADGLFPAAEAIVDAAPTSTSCRLIQMSQKNG